MIIHFSILLLILLVSAFYEHQFRANKIKVIADGGTAADFKGSIIPWLIIFGFLTYLAAMRSSMNDTSNYVHGFNDEIATWTQIKTYIAGDRKDKGFYILQVLFKMYISRDYHLWFFFVAAIESILFIHVFRTYTISLMDACYYFFASTLYYNYFSMMRQWLAVSIVFFAGAVFLKNKKYIPYILLCILAALFHTSALFMIALIVFANVEPWSKKQGLLTVLFIVGLLALQPILSSSDSTYSYVGDTMQQGMGSSPFRILIEAIPVMLAFIVRNNKTNDRLINVCINFSVVNLIITILATVTSGLYLIRMTIYTSMFNVILYPYLFHILLNAEKKSMYRSGFYVFYFVFYIFQMNYSSMWKYSSNILGRFL